MPIAATDFKDFYEILGVSKTATPEEIERFANLGLIEPVEAMLRRLPLGWLPQS